MTSTSYYRGFLILRRYKTAYYSNVRYVNGYRAVGPSGQAFQASKLKDLKATIDEVAGSGYRK